MLYFRPSPPPGSFSFRIAENRPESRGGFLILGESDPMPLRFLRFPRPPDTCPVDYSQNGGQAGQWEAEEL